MKTITCSVKQATKLMEHLNEDEMVILTIIDKRKKKVKHSVPQRIKKKNGEELLYEAETIEYQDNDIFGRFSFYSEEKENIIQNILFPQLE